MKAETVYNLVKHKFLAHNQELIMTAFVSRTFIFFCHIKTLLYYEYDQVLLCDVMSHNVTINWQHCYGLIAYSTSVVCIQPLNTLLGSIHYMLLSI